jgi:type IV pilus assembly protein PilX
MTMNRHERQGQRGMALITSLLLLIVLTIMALSMMRSYGIEERIAGNTRDKQRAFNAAVSAQQYAEYWLSSGVNLAPASCASVVPSTTGQVCSPPALTPTTLNALPWAAGVTYTQFTTSQGGSTVANTVSSTSPGVGTYSLAPVFYITDLGTPASGSGELYQIDAVGYGGSQSTVAIVESTYVVSSNIPQDPTQP